MQLNRRRILFSLILIAGLTWILVSADRSHASTGGYIPAPQKGFSAPTFTLNNLDGKPVALSDYHGKAVLINLWATWCPPCQQEMPTIESFYQQYQDRGFVVLGVNVTAQDYPTQVAPFVQKYNLSFPILLDEDNKVASLYSLQKMPTSFFVGRDGVIKDVVIGPLSDAQLRTDLETILQ